MTKVRRVRPKTRFYGFLIVLMVLIFGISVLVFRGKLMGKTRTLNEMRAQQTELAVEVSSMEAETNYVQTDDYIERAARDELGWMYPGEVRYVGQD